jgi:acyl transferase domain-containing protein
LIWNNKFEDLEDLVPGQNAPGEDVSDSYFLLDKIDRLWLYGVKIDWSEFYSAEKRYRVPLTTYPFERWHYPIAGDPFKMISEMLLKVQAGKEE